ncbi:MAG: hypothetical protein HY902_00780 [Deltaproteobacteria bacterium]|nr:hypothetical protein [Deltaproteobacteria bacterium]
MGPQPELPAGSHPLPGGSDGPNLRQSGGVPWTRPSHLTFFVELPGTELEALLSDAVLATLAQARAGLAVAMLDLQPERAVALRRAAAHGVELTAWLVLDPEDGYWLTVDNARHAAQRWQQVREWLAAEALTVQAVGLDIELPEPDAVALMRAPGQAVRQLWRQRRRRGAVAQAVADYRTLVAELRASGLRVETYQFPLVVEERAAASTLLQRVLGIADVRGDREVLMLYRSVLPQPWGHWLIDLWGGDAEAIAVGISGGGVASLQGAFANRLLDLEALRRELARARHFGLPLYVFSLEGCIAADMLVDLLDQPLPAVARPRAPVALRGLRWLLRTALRVDRVWGRLGRRT